MNYLAHALLSGDSPGVLIGNLAADSLKGPVPPDLPSEVLRGLQLHRRIDRITDLSNEFADSKALFSPAYGKFAHILVDIAFDHLLCASWERYCDQPFPVFVQWVYAVLRAPEHMLPQAFVPLADRMCRNDWLTAYKDLQGLATAYDRVGRRLRLAPDCLTGAVSVVRKYRQTLQERFDSLFPKLQTTAEVITA